MCTNLQAKKTRILTVYASMLPPNQTAYLCIWWVITWTSIGFGCTVYISTNTLTVCIVATARPHPGPAEGKEKWVKHTPMASAGARAYNVGLGRSPQPRSRGQSPRWGSGGKAPCSQRGFCV